MIHRSIGRAEPATLGHGINPVSGSVAQYFALEDVLV